MQKKKPKFPDGRSPQLVFWLLTACLLRRVGRWGPAPEVVVRAPPSRTEDHTWSGPRLWVKRGEMVLQGCKAAALPGCVENAQPSGSFWGGRLPHLPTARPNDTPFDPHMIPIWQWRRLPVLTA